MNALQYSKKNTKKLTKDLAVSKRPSSVSRRRSVFCLLQLKARVQE
jgi:hypothetical protein